MFRLLAGHTDILIDEDKAVDILDYLYTGAGLLFGSYYKLCHALPGFHNVPGPPPHAP